MINRKRQRDDSISNLEDKNSSGSEKFIISSTEKKKFVSNIQNKKSKSTVRYIEKIKKSFYNIRQRINFKF